MRVALFQMNGVWEDAARNRRHAEEQIARSGADLFVLPEMFNTGFTMSPERVAEPADGETVSWLRETAATRKIALMGSLAVKEADTTGVMRYYNRLCFAAPDGRFSYYDKRHLFRMAGEHNRYMAGGERLIVEYLGWRILPLVCYDLRFPVWARNRGEYDLLIYVASWPESRIRAWTTLLKARAVENLCYVAGVNRVGDDPAAHYSGGSGIYNFYGEPMAEAADYREQVVEAVLDKTALEEFREKFPAHLDADDFTLRL